MLRTFVIVCIGYVFDIAPSFRQAMWTFKMCIVNQKISIVINNLFDLGLEKFDFIILGISSIILLLTSCVQERSNQTIRALLDKKPFLLRYIVVLLLITAIVTFGVYGPGYNPADFVYAQF